MIYTKGVLFIARKKSARVDKILKIFEQIPANKREIVDKLVNNAVFIEEQLEILQENIKENGVVSTYQNGANQWGTKKSPEVETYNALLKNYTSITKQLLELTNYAEDDKDELMSFIRRGKT